VSRKIAKQGIPARPLLGNTIEEAFAGFIHTLEEAFAQDVEASVAGVLDSLAGKQLKI